MYDITTTDAVDYVNRSAKIKNTGFYEGAEINDIVAVVKSIDDKTTFRDTDATIAQSFNTTFNRIVDNYLFGETTPIDIEKMEALKYFAKDDSDLDKWLSRFADLNIEILKNPTNNENKDNLYKFERIYATSLNGFKNEEEALTNDEEFNNDAILNDYFDYYIANESFRKPLVMLLDYKEIEDIDGMIIGDIEYEAITSIVHQNLAKLIKENNLEAYENEITNIFETYSNCGVGYYFIDEESIKAQLEYSNLSEYTDTIIKIFKDSNIFSTNKDAKYTAFKEICEKYEYGEYTDAIFSAYLNDELDYLTETALKNPVFENICSEGLSQSLTLGGE